MIFSFRLQARPGSENTEWMRYIEEISVTEEWEEENIAILFDELSYIAEHPYNLHTVTKEDLERLPFLSDIQIENLLAYVYKYRPLMDIYELKNVEEMDIQTIKYLLPFVSVDDFQEVGTFPSEMKVKKPKQELLLRTNSTIQQKAGYKKDTDKQYLGDPFYVNFRYNMNLSDRLLIGLSGEKDSGEPFYNKGFDYYGYNILFKQLGVIRELHLGNYRLSFGEGLVLNNNFTIGKTADPSMVNRSSNGIKRHISFNENDYFSGVAGNIGLKQFQFYLFYSHRKIDASADNETVSSFKTDGYHRTYNDLLKRKTVNNRLFGNHLSWRKRNLSLGLTFAWYDFGGKYLNPEQKAYNRFYLRGKNNVNTGLSYRYKKANFTFQGETAIDKSGKIASFNKMQLQQASFLDWIISVRYYDRAYNALYAKGFSESSTLQNEVGFYSGVKLRFLKRWEITGYYDYFRFPWMKYGIDSPSSGSDVSLQLRYNANSRIQMSLRYRYREKAENTSSEETNVLEILAYRQHRMKYLLHCSISENVGFHSQFDMNFHRKEKTSFGWSFTQSCFYLSPSSRFRVDGSLAYFHADDWANRISVYEKNVLYAFGFAGYYGRGLRYYLTMKWQVSHPITLYLKAASTRYLDRETVGSGLEEISGQEKSDVYFVLKYKF
jgi:hypothetical protein